MGWWVVSSQSGRVGEEYRVWVWKWWFPLGLGNSAVKKPTTILLTYELRGVGRAVPPCACVVLACGTTSVYTVISNAETSCRLKLSSYVVSTSTARPIRTYVIREVQYVTNLSLGLPEPILYALFCERFWITVANFAHQKWHILNFDIR